MASGATPAGVSIPLPRCGVCGASSQARDPVCRELSYACANATLCLYCYIIKEIYNRDCHSAEACVLCHNVSSRWSRIGSRF